MKATGLSSFRSLVHRVTLAFAYGDDQYYQLLVAHLVD
jgi:hypothetical protein